MKFALVVLIFYLSISLISAFSLFNFLSDEPTTQVTNSVNTYHSTSHRQQQNHLRNITSTQRHAIVVSNKTGANYSPLQRALNQRRYHLRNTTVVHRQADSVNKNSTQLIHQNRALNNSVPFHQANHTVKSTNNGIVHPRFRSFLHAGKNNQTIVRPAGRRTSPQAALSKYVAADNSKPTNSSIINNNIQPYRVRSAHAKQIVKGTGTSLLPQALTTNTTGNNNSQNRQRIPTKSHQQQQSRTFHNVASTRSYINSALKRRKRRNEANTPPSDGFNGMIFSRDLPQ